MRRKESKIPLLLTLIALGFLVHWAVGFVQKHKSPQVDAQPEAQQVVAQDAPLAAEAPTTTVDAAEPTAETAVAAQKQPDAQREAEVVMTRAQVGPGAGRQENRKLTGILDVVDKRG